MNSARVDIDPRLLGVLIDKVFRPGNTEREMTILVDLPSVHLGDNTEWKQRRKMAQQWYEALRDGPGGAHFSRVNLCCYDNVRTNNAELPERLWEVQTIPQEGEAVRGVSVGLREILGRSSVVIAPTELSATAPLKNLARDLDFRGATLPGFTQKMLPALSLDYEKIHARVMEIKRRMDEAVFIGIDLEAREKTYHLLVDTRFRTAHASGGLIREPHSVGNLPSGEAYIVPYEGEGTEPSKTYGMMPVQFGSEIVVYRVEANRAVAVESKGPGSDRESGLLESEPAYGNIAEIGIGVLGEWGVEPAGSILLDEKLGLHIAFGRSDHFGGATGPSSFRKAENVVHIDRVYVPSIQPDILPRKVVFSYPSGTTETIILDGKLQV